MTIAATAPVLVPLATAGLTALASGSARAQQAISFAGALAFLAAALVLVANGADSPAPGAEGTSIGPPAGASSGRVTVGTSYTSHLTPSSQGVNTSP